MVELLPDKVLKHVAIGYTPEHAREKHAILRILYRALYLQQSAPSFPLRWNGSQAIYTDAQFAYERYADSSAYKSE